MSLDQDAIVWAFPGGGGAREALIGLIGAMAAQLGPLLPDPSDDPFEELAAELTHDPTRPLLANPRLQRLFPPALDGSDDALRFWRDSVGAQARARIESADVVVTACEANQDWIGVPLGQADDWLKTLSSLRVFWHAELAGPGRLDEAPAEDESGLADVVDWLGYLVEDLVVTREACLAAGQGLTL